MPSSSSSRTIHNHESSRRSNSCDHRERYESSRYSNEYISHSYSEKQEYKRRERDEYHSTHSTDRHYRTSGGNRETKRHRSPYRSINPKKPYYEISENAMNAPSSIKSKQFSHTKKEKMDTIECRYPEIASIKEQTEESLSVDSEIDMARLLGFNAFSSTKVKLFLNH